MLSIPHLIVIFVVALVIFGPEKLPELARNLGKVMAEFRRATGDLRSTFEGHLREIEREGEARRIRGTPSNLPDTSEVLPAAPAPGTIPSAPPNAAALEIESGAAGSGASNEPAVAPRDQFLPGMAPGWGEPESPVLPPVDMPSAEPSESEKTERVNDDGNSHTS